MTRNERRMTRADVGARAEHARAYLLVADLIEGDETIGARTNVLGSVAVLAGIAACDAMCGHSLGVRSAGDSHMEAIDLLRRATPPTSKAAATLRRLLVAKTDTQYSPHLISDAKARELHRAARQLIDEMELRLRS